MSIYGIGYPTRPLGNTAVRDTAQDRRTTPVAPDHSRPVGTPALNPAATMPATAQSQSLEAPAGTDPELWKVLSADERAYFAKVGAMGPLTYGRVVDSSRNVPSVRGGRLDVKI
jgi:hypothetical protein